MNKLLDNIKKWYGDNFTNEDDFDWEKNQLDIILDQVFTILIRCVLPILSITLIINLLIMFTVPIEVTMSKWFWLKEPLSLLAGYFVFKIFRFGYISQTTKHK